jgi:hypothetical protein
MTANYIINRDPNKFGGQQADYLRRSEEGIWLAAEQMSEAVAKKKDLKQLFFTILDQLGMRRQEIASAHQTDQALLFGKRRMESYAIVSDTPLDGQYVEYFHRILPFFQNTLKGAILPNGDIAKKSFQKTEKVLGRQFEFHVEILTPQERSADEWDMLLSITKLSAEESIPLSVKLTAKIDTSKKEHVVAYNNFVKGFEQFS